MAIPQLRRELYLKIGQEYPTAPASQLADTVGKLLRFGAQLHTLAERICSVDMGGKEFEETEKRQAQYERLVRSECEGVDPPMEPVFSGDPRGNTVKLRVPSGRTDDWGQEGICVPTS